MRSAVQESKVTGAISPEVTAFDRNYCSPSRMLSIIFDALCTSIQYLIIPYILLHVTYRYSGAHPIQFNYIVGLTET